MGAVALGIKDDITTRTRDDIYKIYSCYSVKCSKGGISVYIGVHTYIRTYMFLVDSLMNTSVEGPHRQNGAVCQPRWRHLAANVAPSCGLQWHLSLLLASVCVLSVVDLRRVLGLTSQVYYITQQWWFVHRHTLATPFTSKKKEKRNRSLKMKRSASNMQHDPKRYYYHHTQFDLIVHT